MVNVHGGATVALVVAVLLVLLAVREGKQAVNKFLGIAARSRRELSTTELERALGALDSIGDVVQTDVITRVS